MPQSTLRAFADAHDYESSIRAAQVRVLITGRGVFQAELMRIDLHSLWMQRGTETLARSTHLAVPATRSPIFFLADPMQRGLVNSGVELQADQLLFWSPGAEHFQRTSGGCRWASMSLTPGDLMSAAVALLGRELSAPQSTQLVRPDPAAMARLRRLHAIAGRMARVTPPTLAHPELARGIEQALVHGMVTCLDQARELPSGRGSRQHLKIMRRFADVLEANLDRPLHLAELCATLGAPERTLRACCQEHLGMGPIQYLTLRRMHLARRALMRAMPGHTTVTSIAMDHGFWELGRFSVNYRQLFGELPRATLAKPFEQTLPRGESPFAL